MDSTRLREMSSCSPISFTTGSTSRMWAIRLPPSRTTPYTACLMGWSTGSASTQAGRKMRISRRGNSYRILLMM